MRLDELERAGQLAKPRGKRERGVVALVEERSGLVLPLPSGSVVTWSYFGDGSGAGIIVYDGFAMGRRMRAYPEYFDKDVALNEDDVERDIAGCLETLEYLSSDSPMQENLLHVMPGYVFAKSGEDGSNGVGDEWAFTGDGELGWE